MEHCSHDQNWAGPDHMIWVRLLTILETQTNFAEFGAIRWGNSRSTLGPSTCTLPVSWDNTQSQTVLLIAQLTASTSAFYDKPWSRYTRQSRNL